MITEGRKGCKLLFMEEQGVRYFVAQQIYNIDVYTDNYLPSFFNDLFRLLPNCFLLLGCGNFSVTFAWLIFKDPIESRHKVIGIGKYTYLTPSLSSVLL